MSGRLVSSLVLAAVFSPALAAQDRTSERFDLALGLIQRGMHDDAARQLKRFLAEHPQHEKRGEACYRLGTCCLEQQDPDGAIDAFRDALEAGAFKLRAECLYRLGLTLKPKDPKAAAKQFAKLVKENGVEHYLAAASLYGRGESLRAAGDDKAALSSYTQAAAADQDKAGPIAAPSLYQAGFIQLRAKDYPSAGKLFGDAADRYPEHPAQGECRFLQGEAALRAERFDDATKAFRRAVGAGGDFADDAAMGIGHAAVGAGQTEAAVGAFRAVAESMPKSPFAPKALLEAGRVCFDARQFDRAETQLNQLLQRTDLPAEIAWPGLELRGLARLELKRPEDAAADLTRAVATAPGAADKGRILYSLGEAYADAGEWKPALEAYRRCRATTPSEELKGDALYGQCLALHRMEGYEESNQRVAELLQQHPKHRLRTVGIFAGGENSFALKRYADADIAYSQIPNDHELAGKAAFKRAWCSYLDGDFKAGAARFAAIANARGSAFQPLAEEALSMEALAWFEAGSLLPALKSADRYRQAYPQGAFLARTERVAARVLKRQGKLKEAGSRLAVAASVETSGDVASGDRLEYAEVLFKQGKFEEAHEAYAALAARKDKVGGRAHEGLAWCAFELGDDEACRSWISKGLAHEQIGDGRAGLLELQSALAHRQKDWAEAEKIASLYLSEFRDHPRAGEMGYALGVAQARAEKFAEARSTLEPLRKAKLDRIDRVHYELGWVCQRLEDQTAALAAFEDVVRTSEDVDLVGEARLHIGEARLTAKDATGLKWLEAVKGRYTARAQYLCGFFRFEHEEYAPALVHFDRIVHLGEGELLLEAAFFAGECLFRQGKFAAAVPRYESLLQREPGHQRAQVARLHQGQCRVQAGEARAGAMVLQDYLRRAAAAKADKGDLARANLWLGKARQAEKDFDRAAAAYREVTDLTDSELSAEAQFRIGECRMEKGSLSDAVDSFVKLSILYNHPEWVQRGLSAAGDCYLKLEKPKKAAKLFEELVQRFPKSELAKTAQAKLKNIRSMQP